MRLHTLVRWGTVVISAAALLAVPACGGGSSEPLVPTPNPSGSLAPGEPLKNEIPPAELEKVMAAHYRGLGLMEQYEYAQATSAFREVRKRAPGWIPGMINLAIALLNDDGAKADQPKSKKDSASEPTEGVSGRLDEALELLAGVLERDPENPHAHYCRGIILEQAGRMVEANHHFQKVTEIDSRDAISWFKYAATMYDAENPVRFDARKLAKQQIEPLKMALKCDPSLAPALYKLAQVYQLTNEPTKARAFSSEWQELNPDRGKAAPGPGTAFDLKYGDMGKYATIVDPFPRPAPTADDQAVPPNLEAARALQVKLPEGDRWVRPSDFTGSLALLGRARRRFGAPVAAFDADQDGRLDLYLPAAVAGSYGVRDVLLLNKGDGRFDDASAAFGLPREHPSLGVAAADFDADRYIDVLLTGFGQNRLLRNRDGKRFEDVSSILKPTGPPAVSLMARWVDLDQDGDLDLYIVNYCAAAQADRALDTTKVGVAGVANSVYRNDGQPDEQSAATPQGRTPIATAFESTTKAGLSLALVPWPDAPAILGGTGAHTGIAVLDIDGDRDLDVVLSAEGMPPIALLNDRLGRFHEAKVQGSPPIEGLSGLLATPLDLDDLTDLVATCPTGPVVAWRNASGAAGANPPRISLEAWPDSATHWRSAQAIDLDLDGRADLLGLPASSDQPGNASSPAWARNEGKRLVPKALSLKPDGPGADGLLAVDLIGDPLPDVLMIQPGEPPALARNLGNGHHWLSLQLGGYWRVKPHIMRTNSHAIGARVNLEGEGLYVSYEHTTPESGLGQSITPVVLGLGKQPQAHLVRVRWPDTVIQCELNVSADEQIKLAENNRKTGSCPVLFTWNGRRFVCIGDFLGGGGLGYLIAPGVYSQPDRDEAVAITAEQLRESGGYFRLSVTEPMDEIAYLDHLRLDVVDRPPGALSTPDERFAPNGPRPSGDVIAWRTSIEPERATDLEGRDVTETLRHWDRRTVDTFRTRSGWIGYAREHGIILDFGDRLSRFSTSDPLVLCLAGWVEYPYSQTNYAAATAGVALKPPSIERLDESGKWQLIEPHAGYPAGMPRIMTLELTGKLAGPKCVLRIKTNMECYYDQAFIAVRDRAVEAALRVTKLHVTNAVLGYRGYTREVSPDGQQPLVYDYDYVDPAPLARFSGKLTRYGDVAPLLRSDDDELCVVGPGDEVRLEFSTSSLPDLPAGWTRSYVLRTYGYCKDADLFTATSNTVDPLPWRGMPPFPFAPGVTRPVDPAYESYLRSYQTRPAGGGIHR